jgi:hypothetical protein
LAVLGVELKASCLLGRSSSTSFALPTLFCIGYFSLTLCLGLPGSSYACTPWFPAILGMGSCELFALLSHDSPDLCLLSS